MDGLSAVASGIAVVSLALQLVQSVGTIRTFVRDVKDAPKELERLVELLERLGALLEDVRAIMERQSSLQGQQFPAPSMTIFKCLQGCERTLQPLQEVVEKYSKPIPHSGSVMAKLKSEIKLGFKAKDIVGFEMRLEQEINYLHAALGMNQTAILVNVLPSLFHVQEVRTATQLQASQAFNSSQNLSAVTSKCNEPSSTALTGLEMIRRTFRVRSPFDRIGLNRQKSICAIRHGTTTHTQCEDDQIEIIYEQNRYTWSCWYLGYGFQWDRQCGSILPSLTVYPVVADFDREVYDLFESGSIIGIQQLFSSGEVHPFVRDRYGWSLLHIAALRSRPDVCRLLLAYGLRPDLTDSGYSPFTLALDGYTSLDEAIIEVYRLLFPSQVWLHDASNLSSVIDCDLDVIEWLWVNSREFYAKSSALVEFQTFLLRYIMGLYWLDTYSKELINRRIVSLMNSSVLDAISKEPHGLVSGLFLYNDSPLGSFEIGSAFINLVSTLGLDVQAFMAKEIKSLPEQTIRWCWDGRQKIICERHHDQGWILGWEWSYDPQAPGHLVASEYSVMAGRSWYRHTEDVGLDLRYDEPSLASESRFIRRMAPHARKERARTGKKRPRSKMPGAWS